MTKKDRIKKIVKLECKKHIKIYALNKIGLSNKEVAKELSTNTGHVYNALKMYKGNRKLKKIADEIGTKGKVKGKKKVKAKTKKKVTEKVKVESTKDDSPSKERTPLIPEEEVLPELSPQVASEQNELKEEDVLMADADITVGDVKFN